MPKLYNKIRKYRLEAGLSQQQLADKLKVSREAISKWENNANNPSKDKWALIAKILKTDWKILFDLK